MKPKPLGRTLHCYTGVMAHRVRDVWQFPQQRISLWFLLSSELNWVPCCWTYATIKREWGKGMMFIQAQTNKKNGGISNQSSLSFWNPDTLLANALMVLLHALEMEKLYLFLKGSQLEICPSKIWDKIAVLSVLIKQHPLTETVGNKVLWVFRYEVGR